MPEGDWSQTGGASHTSEEPIPKGHRSKAGGARQWNKCNKKSIDFLKYGTLMGR